MNLAFRLHPILIGAAIIAVQPQVVVALTPIEISVKAEQITVRIDGKNDKNSGSGVIIERNGDNYLVITNWHVIDTSGNYTVQTYDGKKYAVNYSQVKRLPGVDLAILQFTSSQNYQIAEIGNSDEIKTGMNVYATGFPLPGPGTPKRSYRFLPGLITGRNPDAQNGYELTYTIEPIPGMSGGPIFNEQGLLVGIYGQGDRDIRTGRASLGLGIPINTYKKFASVASSPESKIQPQPPNPNIEVNKKAEEFYNQGNEKYEKGNWQSVLADYNKALEIWQGALPDYNKALKINPNYAADYNRRGLIRNSLGDKQGAIADYNQALKISPNYAGAYYYRGILRRDLGDKQGAISDLQKAAELYNKQGVSYESISDSIKAIQQEL